MPELVLELLDLSLNGVTAFSRIEEAIEVLGNPDARSTRSIAWHSLGIEVLPTIDQQCIAYIFLFARPRTKGQYDDGPFRPFAGRVAFRGTVVDFHNREVMERLFRTGVEVFRFYERTDSYVRYILVSDPEERRIGFFFQNLRELDHILLN
jgi:hypothetical protein